jgi:hypothetical protein
VGFTLTSCPWITIAQCAACEECRRAEGDGSLSVFLYFSARRPASTTLRSVLACRTPLHSLHKTVWDMHAIRIACLYAVSLSLSLSAFALPGHPLPYPPRTVRTLSGSTFQRHSEGTPGSHTPLVYDVMQDKRLTNDPEAKGIHIHGTVAVLRGVPSASALPAPRRRKSEIQGDNTTRRCMCVARATNTSLTQPALPYTCRCVPWYVSHSVKLTTLTHRVSLHV